MDDLGNITAGVEEKRRTPVYEKSFGPNTDKLHHLLGLSSRAVQSYFPQLSDAATQINDLPVSSVDKNEKIKRIAQDILEQSNEFTGGILLIHELVPVLTVTTVEAYLKDVLAYAAGIDDTLMASSEQTASYANILSARSLQDLLDELRGNWARKFVDNGGPTEWMRRLEAMGARGYSPDTRVTMENLWSVRHLVVHSSGIVTPEFVRRHPSFQKKVGDRLIVSSGYFKKWFAAIYDFVEVTDLYFLQRCERASTVTARAIE